MRRVETDSGTTHKLWVRFVSKTAMTGLAAKHQLGEKVHATVTPLASWDNFAVQIGLSELATGGVTGEVFDPIGQGQGKPGGVGMTASEAPVNRLGYTPSRNGDGDSHGRAGRVC